MVFDESFFTYFGVFFWMFVDHLFASSFNSLLLKSFRLLFASFFDDWLPTLLNDFLLKSLSRSSVRQTPGRMT